MIKIALFASGTGSNAMNLLKAAEGLERVEIPLLIVDQAASELPSKVRSEFPKVKVELIETQAAIAGKPGISPAERKHIHEAQVLSVLKKYSIDWCFLAGYMRLIGPTLLGEFSDLESSRIINIHPSLLPAYPGLNAYEQAFASKDLMSGVTVHFVDSGMDTGKVIAQDSFPRMPGDTFETFVDRGKKIEWQLYAEVLKRLSDEGHLNFTVRNL